MSDTARDGEHRHKSWSEISGRAKALIIAGIVVLVPCVLLLCGLVTMWLWNALMPGIFKLPAIGFWQAIGLLLLTQIFFKGGHAAKAGRGHWKRRQVWKHMREGGSGGESA